MDNEIDAVTNLAQVGRGRAGVKSSVTEALPFDPVLDSNSIFRASLLCDSEQVP